jgi:hypothetical protein
MKGDTKMSLPIPMMPPFDNAERCLYFRTVRRADLPSGPRRSLKALPEYLKTMECDYCGRVGTVRLEDRIFHDRCEATYPDGRVEDTHTCYRIHAVCHAKHRDERNYNASSRVHCFYLTSRGHVGIHNHCIESHEYGQIRR